MWFYLRSVYGKQELGIFQFLCVSTRNSRLNFLDLLSITENLLRDHPFKTSAYSRGGGVKNLPNLPTDSTKKLPTVGG